MSVLYCSSDEKSQQGVADAESVEALKEKLQGLKEQLAFSQTELKELREQMRLGVLSVECGLGDTAAERGSGTVEEGPSPEAQQLRVRVTQLEEQLAQRCGDSDTIKQLTKKVEDLQVALAGKHKKENDGEGDDTETVKFLRGRVAELEAALAQNRTLGIEGRAAGGGDQICRLQERVAELEGQLRKCVPRSELEEVQVTLGLQCEQLARERAEVARRLNDALLDLERLRPPQAGDEEEEEEEEEQSVSSEPSLSGEQYYLLPLKPLFRETVCEKSCPSLISELQTLPGSSERRAGGGQAGSSPSSGLSVC